MSLDTSDLPKVTVLMSVFNGQRYLQSAINSILAQTFEDYEFLIINDGSTDSTREILERQQDPRIRLISYGTSIGLTKALNLGLRRARGQYVARQDHDDISMPERLELQTRYLDSHDDVAIIGGQFSLIDSRGARSPMPAVQKALGMQGILLHLAIDNPFVHSAVMFRKSVVVSAGGYNEKYRTSQDIELWSRLLSRYNGANLPAKILDFRVHDASVSSGRYRTNQGEERQRTIRRGTNLMCSNVRRLFPQEHLSDHWVNLYVGIYVERWPKDSAEASQLADGMRYLRHYAQTITGADRRYAMRLICSKCYLISMFLLRGFFINAGLRALAQGLLADWRYLLRYTLGTAVGLVKRLVIGLPARLAEKWLRKSEQRDKWKFRV